MAEQPPPSLALSVGSGALAPALAAVVTNPADVAKTRLNMMLELQAGRVSTSVVECLRGIHATEGVAGLQRGLGFVLVREASKNAFRLGLFEPTVALLHPDRKSKPSTMTRVTADFLYYSLTNTAHETTLPVIGAGAGYIASGSFSILTAGLPVAIASFSNARDYLILSSEPKKRRDVEHVELPAFCRTCCGGGKIGEEKHDVESGDDDDDTRDAANGGTVGNQSHANEESSLQQVV